MGFFDRLLRARDERLARQTEELDQRIAESLSTLTYELVRGDVIKWKKECQYLLRVASGPATVLNDSAAMSREKLVAHGVVELTALLTAECDLKYIVEKFNTYDTDVIDRIASLYRSTFEKTQADVRNEIDRLTGGQYMSLEEQILALVENGALVKVEQYCNAVLESLRK